MNARTDLVQVQAQTQVQAAFGVFSFAGMQLALPLESLRELLPLSTLHPLPCAAPGVVGGLDMRGMLVPVLDLCVLLGKPQGSPAAAVVIVAHQGRLLGLLADGGIGVFTPEPDALIWMETQQGSGALLAGAFARPDAAGMVSLLAPEALMGLPGVPAVRDRQGRQAALAEAALTDDRSDHLVLVGAAGVPFAVSSAAVHTTLLKPDVRESSLTGGYCLGVLIHEGQRIPAVDLLALCGLGQLRKGAPQQAFLLRYARGLVAFVVSQIIDVSRADLSRVVPLPERAFRFPGLVTGALPASACLTQIQSAATGAFAHFLLIQAQALLMHRDLCGMAAMNLPVEGGARGAQQDQPTHGEAYAEHCQVLTYSLGFEVITPVEQIVEIMPWRPEEAVMGTGGQVAGLAVSRSRAVTLYFLQALLELPASPFTDSASVLVVRHGDGHVGYIVPALVSIDDAPRPRRTVARRGDSPASHLGACSPVLVGRGSEARLLGVLDLQALTCSLLGEVPQPAPTALPRPVLGSLPA